MELGFQDLGEKETEKEDCHIVRPMLTRILLQLSHLILKSTHMKRLGSS